MSFTNSRTIWSTFAVIIYILLRTDPIELHNWRYFSIDNPTLDPRKEINILRIGIVILAHFSLYVKNIQRTIRQKIIEKLETIYSRIWLQSGTLFFTFSYFVIFLIDFSVIIFILIEFLKKITEKKKERKLTSFLV